MSKDNRGTIFLEDARVLSQLMYPAEQFVLRVHAPKCAARARAGMFAHLTCDPALPMRRPLSIMRVDAKAGWVDFLYKIVVDGLRQLSARRPGATLSGLGPIGKPFEIDTMKPLSLLIGGGVGIPPMVFLAEEMARHDHMKPLVLMGSEVPFPFKSRGARNPVAGLPDAIDQTMPLLDEAGIQCRLASGSNFPGCFNGFVTELADTWLNAIGDKKKLVSIYACGPEPMLEATAALARHHQLPCQV